MILKEAISKWTQKDGEIWFINNIARIVEEIHTARDSRLHDDFEEVLWKSVDILDNSPWTISTQLTFVELAMDTSLLIGGRDLFNEFFDWFDSREHKSLHRHKGAKVFLNALNSSTELQNKITECQHELETSLKGDVDLKWTSISIIALVDLAHRYLPLSATLPKTLHQSFYYLFENCGIEWFVDDLFLLNPNTDSWTHARNEILTPWYTKFLGIHIPKQVSIETTHFDNVNDHLHLLNAQKFTLPLKQIIQQAKAKRQTLENKDEIWKSLERGTTVISNTGQLDTYLASYGTKHIAKLNYILDGNYGHFSPERIVDWGCGQGLGALSLLDRFGIKDCLREIILIEPSDIALNRAEYLIRRHEHGANKSVLALRGYFDDSTLNNHRFSGATIHMFSNVLDMEGISLENTYELVCSKFTGKQLFFLISPFMGRVRSARLFAFQNMFSHHSEYIEHIQIDNDYLTIGNATITARVFSCVLP